MNFFLLNIDSINNTTMDFSNSFAQLLYWILCTTKDVPFHDILSLYVKAFQCLEYSHFTIEEIKSTFFSFSVWLRTYSLNPEFQKILGEKNSAGQTLAYVLLCNVLQEDYLTAIIKAIPTHIWLMKNDDGKTPLHVLSKKNTNEFHYLIPKCHLESTV